MNKSTFFNDSLSSLTVLLVALPVSLGVAVASGLPPIYGLYTAIIGGLIVGPLGGCSLQISGPSTGLAVMVLHVIQNYGIESLIPLCLITGIFQIIIAFFKKGHLFQATPPSLVKAMLCGIGFLILISQLFLLFGFSISSKSYLNIIEFPKQISNLFSNGVSAVILHNCLLALSVIVVLITWPMIKSEKLQKIPASVIAILTSALVAYTTGWDVKFVTIPSDALSNLGQLDYMLAFSYIDISFVLYAIGFAFVASVETMLCVSALDQITHKDSSFNRTILSQGVGNLLASLVGTIPVVGVISRSAANLEANSETKLAGFLHGIWMLSILFVPFILEVIPQAALLGLLIFIGIKLLDPAHILDYIRNYNRTSLIFFTTFSLTITLDLLIGVIAGFLVAVFLLLADVLKYDLKVEDKKGNKVLKFTGKLSFLDLPVLNKELSEHTENVPSNIEVCLREVMYLDPAIQKKLDNLKNKLEKKGHTVKIKR